MKKIEISTSFKKLLADVYTPVGIYLRLRDRFRDTILMESTDFHAAENSYSFIGINAIAGIEITDTHQLEYKLPLKIPKRIPIKQLKKVPEVIWDFMQRFEIKEPAQKPVNIAQGMFGYTTYDAIPFFENISFNHKVSPGRGDSDDGASSIPLMRYRLYQYIIAINHFKNQLFICENHINGLQSEIDIVESLIKSKDVPTYPFKINGAETSSLTDAEYIDMVKKGIAHCHRGDVFQIVLSKRFQQLFTGDEFMIYRALRNINPSPYLFYFDYGEYKLMGSSPESQLIIQDNKSIMHPIAGTYKRTGNDEVDEQLAKQLLCDEKENAEHVMLVDLARNDLSRMCDSVEVSSFCKVQYYSHVIHLVSEVTGKVKSGTNPFEVLATTFPAGTLSGAPKFRAMQLINEYEPTARSYYGGCIGFMGFNGSCIHAIMIRTFLSRNNTLIYQAGAGIVAVSNPETELQEVNNKLNALKSAIALAQNI
ncbi:MAG: anthranilate synthase component I family protein [Ginsengibacter sp.]